MSVCVCVFVCALMGRTRTCCCRNKYIWLITTVILYCYITVICPFDVLVLSAKTVLTKGNISNRRAVKMATKTVTTKKSNVLRNQ